MSKTWLPAWALYRVWGPGIPSKKSNLAQAWWADSWDPGPGQSMGNRFEKFFLFRAVGWMGRWESLPPKPWEAEPHGPQF